MRFLRKWLYYGWSVLEIVWGIRNWPEMLLLLLRKNAVGAYQVRLRHPRVELDIRGAMDLWAVKETFLDAFYTRFGVSVREGWMVVDIGAGVGDFSILAAYSHPETQVFAYEPFPGSFKLLERNLIQNDLDNISAHQQAVWGQSGNLTLDLSGGEPLQLTSRKKEFWDGQKQVLSVQALTLQEILKFHSIERVDLLKLDCEGAEYSILMEAPIDVLERIDRIIMEVHDQGADRDHQVLSAFLQASGYRVNWHPNIVHGDIGYLFASRVD